MTFYIKKDRISAVEGPFTIEKINEMVRLKRFTSDSLLIQNAGQNVREIADESKYQWTKLADAPGFVPDPKAKRGCLTIMVIMLIIYATIVIVGLVKLLDKIHRIQ